jgi:hypothetical protein
MSSVNCFLCFCQYIFFVGKFAMHSVFIIVFISKLTWDLNIAKESIYDMKNT